MDGVSEIQQNRERELNHIMEKVRHNTEGEDGEGVIFIKDIDVTRPEVQAANRIFDGLMMTLGIIAEDSKKIALESNGSMNGEYEQVLRAIEPITAASAGLAADSIPLRRATNSEQAFKEKGDDVRVYTADEFKLGDAAFDFMKVFIRPKRFERRIERQAETDRVQINTREYDQPRMRIRVVPRDSGIGVVEIRLDQEDADRGMVISYDIEIGNTDLIQSKDLIFSKDSGQREATHHFSSDFTTKSLGVGFDQMLNAMGDKIDRGINPPAAGIGIGNRPV